MSLPGGARHFLLPAAVAGVVVGLWQAWVTLAAVPAYLVPSPGLVLKSLVNDWAILGPALLFTLKVALLALCVSTILGVLAAFVFVQSRALETALFPFAILLQVTPIVAVAPLIIIWVSNMTASLVICAVLMALFPIISNTTLGLRSVDPGLRDYFILNRASRWQTLVRLRVPSALPAFFGGLRISSGLSLIGAIVAEFVAGTGGNNNGLAYQILTAGYQLNIARMFAALLLVAAAGVALFALMGWLSRLALGRRLNAEAAHD